ncbi:MAG: hypothetical protein KDE27_26005 [Planctomycetes bacterium]|nr:hypothetical protein [Planctomycetota bacterium]
MRPSNARIVLTSLMALPLMSFKCGSNTSTTTEVVTPSGTVKNTTEVTKPTTPKHKLNFTQPPEHPGGPITIGETTITLPANPTTHSIPMVLEFYDPLVMQIPLDWTLTGGTYTTSGGSGNITISQGRIPSGATYSDNAYGGVNVVVDQFFVPEPGYHLYLLDIPEAHKTGGNIDVSWTIEAPVGSQRVDTVKLVPTFKTVVKAPGGTGNPIPIPYPPPFFYAPIDGTTSILANLTDPRFAWTYDLSGPLCSSPAGNSPTFDLANGSTWQINQTSVVSCIDLDTSMAGALILGATPYQPGIPYGNPGCKLSVSVDQTYPLVVSSDGTSDFSVSVPNDPGLVDAVVYWQVAQTNSGTGDVVMGSTIKVRIEPLVITR